jgi:hypothetical protein
MTDLIVAKSAHPLARLREPGTIRARCRAVARAVEQGVSPYFKLDRGALDAVAERVAALTLARFPDLRIPFHSRWRHFEAGGVDRKAQLDAALAGLGPADRARAQVDLVVVSVLLDAGAGPLWSYDEQAALDTLAMPAERQGADELQAMLSRAAAGSAGPGPDTAAPPPAAADGRAKLTRSEGLGVASLRAFLAGVFSGAKNEPARADAATLRQIDAAALRAVFQVSPSNPMVGLEGRAALIARLGAALAAEAAVDGTAARPSLIFDRVTAHGTRTRVTATEVLGEVLRTLAPIWTSGSRVLGLPAGDVWPHVWAGDATGTEGDTDRATSGYVPFHKLSQWLTYSLLEPLQWAGVQVDGIDALTGLPEYRNGGLLLDAGVIVPRDVRLLARNWKPSDDFVIEWRALTVVLLDEVAERVRQRLGRSADELPLACILEGGTWAAGRQIAAEKRAGGAPPLNIDSDGTVF